MAPTFCVSDIQPRCAADVQTRIKGEYLEMPGLILSVAQAQRLWGLDQRSCERCLGALVGARFLRRTLDGRYVRADRSAA